MGQIVSLAVIHCCCTSASSLCNSCFGTTAVGTTGRKRSVLLLSMAIAVALWFQYSVGPSIVSQEGWIWKTYRMIPGSGKLVYNAWHESCAKYDQDSEENNGQALMEQCAGNAGVFRPTFLTTLYFLANAAATYTVPALNREAWPAKYALFFFGLAITMFIPNNPLFSGFYLWLARLGAGVFVVMQQIILIDVAYNWNDSWVEKANEADRLSYGSGTGWLHAIVGVCVGLYCSCAVWIGLLYTHFADCPGNTWVITLTLLAIIGLTVLQLAGTEGSLLTSSVISLYAVYLCFSIVSKNPRGECNPRLGKNDVWGITIGLLLTTISLAWTGWSWSAEARLNVDAVQSAKSVQPTGGTSSESAGINLDVPLLDGEEAGTSGLVSSSAGEGAESASLAHVWKLNIIMALISCYVAMILTSWGTVDGLDENHNAANPTIGRWNMAILGLSQWLAIGLYAWTLIAPRLFPDRDFS
ncbi:serine incorporator domain containing protein [Nitzschia inconspicua]|uniref:Serine incorporator domain containing protein n=1 Tax=Nitzschia inconspicua TaxID=303405 RepID=A0A9K3KQA6_9STRA|nr:serine incorporator domain containing protein [Nitzschia inconspicua]KAG7347566.1 serine incorporator domain containing protein [Nitzschia inconspicua]